MPIEQMRKAFTPKRLELWRTIRDQHPESIAALVKLTSRDAKSVLRDLDILVSLSLVELQTCPGPTGKVRRPVSMVSRLWVEIT
jgi:predicted transcriptional regulator